MQFAKIRMEVHINKTNYTLTKIHYTLIKLTTHQQKLTTIDWLKQQ